MFKARMAKIHYTPNKTPLPNMLFHQYIQEHLQASPDKIYLVDATNGVRLTYREVVTISTDVACGLHNLGLRKGDILSTVANNSCQLVCLMLGASQVGAVVNTITPASTEYELSLYLSDISPDMIFTEAIHVEKVQNATASRKPTLILAETYPGVVSFDDLLRIGRQSPVDLTSSQAEIGIDDVTFILFSSGTTGRPKGVRLSHRNLVSILSLRAEFARLYSPEQQQATVVTMFPLYHMGGLFYVYLTGLLGGTYVFHAKYSVQTFLESIDRYKPKGLIIPPTVVMQMFKSGQLSKYDTSSVVYIICGTAPLKQSVESAFVEHFGNVAICQAYGMTESTAGYIFRGSTFTQRTGSVGKVLPGVEVKIIDIANQELLGPGKTGEICVRGPIVMKGYHNRPEESKQIIDQDGWLHSGDLGYYDEENNFYIVDRIKELIKYKGNQVAPAELEALLLNHDDVAEVCVLGVPDVEAGELPRAYIVKQPGASVTKDQIHKYVNARLAYYKWLRGGIVFVESIPKLPNGKLLRRELRKLVHSNI